MERMEESDAAQVARARSGDEEAFRVLVERHSRAVFRLAYRMTGNDADAEDVVQEAFLKAYRSLGRFDERSAFSSWLYRITANTALDQLRARKRREAPLEHAEADEAPSFDVPAPEPGPERVAMGGEVQRRVKAALARLSERERAAFVLRHFEGMTTEEIGDVLGLEAGAAKHSVFRAVRKLRAALEPFVAPQGAASR
jgi:RNA polymerase sigma-70 factor, ECF subfamily